MIIISPMGALGTITGIAIIYLTKELTEELKQLAHTNYIYGQVSLNELQRIDLIQAELTTRQDYEKEEFEKWYKKSRKRLRTIQRRGRTMKKERGIRKGVKEAEANGSHLWHCKKCGRTTEHILYKGTLQCTNKH